MITFLSSPKAFKNEFKGIQERAVQSWKNTHPEAEVILFHREEGVAGAAAALGARHVPEIATSPRGVPRFDAMAAHAAREGRFDLQAYLNCDILLAPDFLARIAPVRLPRFLLVGQCVNLTREAAPDVSAADWTAEIRRLGRLGQASVRPVCAVDFFVFPRGLFEGLDPLVCGRYAYDAALIAFCLRRGIPVVDASWDVRALHQFHDYKHVAGGYREVQAGEDALFNRTTHDVAHSPPDIADAGFQLRHGRLAPGRCRGDRLRALEIELRFRRGLRYPGFAVRALWRALRGAGLGRNVELTMEQMLD